MIEECCLLVTLGELVLRQQSKFSKLWILKRR